MIIYIHGLNSHKDSAKYTRLKEHFNYLKVVSYSYDSSDFTSIDNMIDIIKLDVENEPNVLFIGSSLGGYISLYLANILNRKCLLLNPCINPLENLKPLIGTNKIFNEDREYELTMDKINYLDKFKVEKLKDISIKIYANKDDKVIDYKKIVDFFKDRKVNLSENGGHRFSNINKIFDDIKDFYYSPF